MQEGAAPFVGGLGHLAVKLAAALGAEVTVLSRTAEKADDARALGATELLLTTDESQLKDAQGRPVGPRLRPG